MTDPTPTRRHPVERLAGATPTPGDGTDGRSGWWGRGAHHRCVGIYDVVCGCTCHAGIDPQELLAVHAAQLPQPTWSGQRHYSPDRGNDGAVVYRWEAPVPAGLTNDSANDDGMQLEVTLQLHRLLTLTDVGTVVVEDEAATVHCDAGDLWLSPTDARAFAAALVACADRADGAGAASAHDRTR